MVSSLQHSTSVVQVTVPDVHPAQLIQRQGLLSVCAGEVGEVFELLQTSIRDQACSIIEHMAWD